MAIVRVEIDGAREAMRSIDQLDKELKRFASRELRAASKKIAHEVARDLPTWAKGAGQAYGVSVSARAKSDRFPTVKIPSTKPRLSGLRRGAPKVHWVQITAGSLGQSRRPQFRGAVDWLAPAIKANNDFVVREYMSALSALLRRVGL